MQMRPIVCYYSSAAPQSGYSSAVRGYAEKCAAALGWQAMEYRAYRSLYDETPEITIGVEADMQPAPRLALKARPYADQHGMGASMHALTRGQLAQCAPLDVPKPMGLVCVANPHWLMSDAPLWAEKCARWAAERGLLGLVVSNSPRSNVLMWQGFCDALRQKSAGALTFNEVGAENAYVQALAQADAICLLGSSRSMAGEAILSGAPITYAGDDAASEAAFFVAIRAQLGEAHAARFKPMGEAFTPPLERYEQLDVTMPYVEAVLRQYRAVVLGG